MSEGLGIIAVPMTMGFCECTSQHRLDKLRLGYRVAFLRFHGQAIVRNRKPTLEGFVLYGHERLTTQVVSERQVITLLLGAADTKMDMVATGPLGRTLEERVHEIELAKKEVRVAQVGEATAIEISRLQRRD